jgi:dTDP-4-amino-4,6-dideoxygalactose transaminase
MIPFNKPYISGNEISTLNEVIHDRKLSGNGSFSKKVKTLLNEEYQFENVFLTTSCTSAIELCALAIDFKEGDEIIIPSYTFSSTPSPFIIRGCKIVFADCEESYPNLSLTSIKTKITKKTKAIMVVHYGGVSNNIEAIKDFCNKNNLILIEDAAQAIGSSYGEQPLGSFGDFSVFSFHETKNITCGEGGMLIVNNNNYLEKTEKIYQYGTNRSDFLSGKIENYEWVSIGLSFTMSEINASFLYSQLENVELITAKRKELWSYYYDLLTPLKKDLKIDFPNKVNDGSNFHNFFILLNSSTTLKELLTYMKKNEIQCTTHYTPLHKSTYAIKNNMSDEPLKNTERFGSNLLRLPLFYDLTEKEILKISLLITRFFETN